MAEPLKFKFDTFFGATGQQAEESPELSFSEDDLQLAKSEAFEHGLAQGREEASQSVEQTMALALSRLAEKADDLDMVQKGELERIRGEAAELAHEIAGKLAKALTTQMPLTETRILLDECLSHLNETPHIVVRVAQELTDTMRDQADALAAERGFSGKIMIMAEPAMPPGDCRIEWADGGIERNTGALSEKIDRAIARHVDVMLNSANPAEHEALQAAVPEHLNSEGAAA